MVGRLDWNEGREHETKEDRPGGQPKQSATWGRGRRRGCTFLAASHKCLSNRTCRKRSFVLTRKGASPRLAHTFEAHGPRKKGTCYVQTDTTAITKTVRTTHQMEDDVTQCGTGKIRQNSSVAHGPKRAYSKRPSKNLHGLKNAAATNSTRVRSLRPTDKDFSCAISTPHSGSCSDRGRISRSTSRRALEADSASLSPMR